MNSSSPLVIQVEHCILHIRGQRVILSHDLAQLYDVPTKALNQAVKRNIERFPDTFAFQLTEEEKNEVVTKSGCVIIQPHGMRFSHLESEVDFSQIFSPSREQKSTLNKNRLPKS